MPQKESKRKVSTFEQDMAARIAKLMVEGKLPKSEEVLKAVKKARERLKHSSE